jgi:V8-like Glu-specific endopeptidase
MEVYEVDSGVHDGIPGESMVAFQEVVRVPGAPWLRVYFSDYNLGQRSHLTITSLKDGSQQRLDARTLPQWGNGSAYFNGEAVTVELHVAPGERGIFFRMEKIKVGDWVDLAEEDLGLESICGTDNRTVSTDGRVARLTFVTAAGNPLNACTAWPTTNGTFLTAGHCVDFDPDLSGPLLPDGVLDLDANDVIEFDVPNSLANGTLVFANSNDQYAINLNSVVWNFDGEGQGFGKDWAVFALFANPNTGLTRHQAQGFFRITNGNPAASNTIRITGYGTDSTPNLTRNQIQQTNSGPYQGESSSGQDIWHRYRVDTTVGNSGSPIIWNSQNLTVGIHTNAGCTSTGGENRGTSFEHNALENALQNFPGNNSVYVDKGMPVLASENGTIFRPFDTVAEGVSTVAAGGIVSIVEGTYNESMTIGKAMTLSAPVGTVTIGN